MPDPTPEGQTEAEEKARLRGQISRVLWDTWLADETVRRAAGRAFRRGDIVEMRAIAQRLDELRAKAAVNLPAEAETPDRPTEPRAHPGSAVLKPG
jgi:hypothetical protein